LFIDRMRPSLVAQKKRALSNTLILSPPPHLSRTTETCPWCRPYDRTTTVADRRLTHGDRRMQSAIDRRRGHGFAVCFSPLLLVSKRTLQKHARGADHTETIADRRRRYINRRMQSAANRRPLQISVVKSAPALTLATLYSAHLPPSSLRICVYCGYAYIARQEALAKKKKKKAVRGNWGRSRATKGPASGASFRPSEPQQKRGHSFSFFQENSRKKNGGLCSEVPSQVHRPARPGKARRAPKPIHKGTPSHARHCSCSLLGPHAAAVIAGCLGRTSARFPTPLRCALQKPVFRGADRTATVGVRTAIVKYSRQSIDTDMFM
jgi:hypothetical protein